MHVNDTSLLRRLRTPRDRERNPPRSSGPFQEEEQSDLIGEPQINALGYSFMEAGRMDDALAFFLLNADEYPESSNVWDSLGEWYMTA
ncbi:MAG: hypothetical protein JXA64_03400 [Candidatus Fermentibacteraceae bacterium]|nr:hypothetical protein [Candidatus Fermentibacteraceae bacterium]MBN2608138.1 hypothetical protein [Candidatus Fermentibacteraceae bacterium]